MHTVPEHLLQPSLTPQRLARSAYSTQVHFLSAFFGGPLAALALSVVNAQRLARWPRDLAWIAPLALLVLAFEWWLVRGSADTGAVLWVTSWLGAEAGHYLNRALALACFGLGTWMHRREQRAADLMGVQRPSGWRMGLLLVVGGSLAEACLRLLLD
jgi:hypothetical protein